MNLKQALNEYKTTLKASRIDPIDGDPRTYPGRSMQRNQAKTELPSKVKALQEALRPVSYLVFIENPKQLKDLVALASEQTETIGVNFSDVLKETVDRVEGTITRSREFTVNSFFALEDSLHGLQFELGLIPKPITMGDVTVLQNREEVAGHVEKYVLKYLGEDFAAAAITRQVIQDAVNLTGEASALPIFVAGLGKEFSDRIGQKVFGGKYVLFEPSEVVDSKEIIKLFTQIKKTLKNQKDN